MSMRDMVSGQGCDPGQSSALHSFAQGVSDHAKMTEDMHRVHSQRNDVDHFRDGPSSSSSSTSRAHEKAEDLDVEFAERLKLGPPDTQAWLEEEMDVNAFMQGEFPSGVDWSDQFWQQHHAQALPEPRRYQFHGNNPFLGTAGAFDVGTKLFHEGQLNEAILAFEAAVQNNPKNSDAWRWLGTSHQENDEDKQAIVAFQNSLDADPENIEALLDVGVSYTNELIQGEAMQYLREWLAQHPEYREIPGVVGDLPEVGGFKSTHDRLIEMFSRASEIDRADPDVYTVLGVLFNLSRDYERAEMALKDAIKLDPQNYSLWNKLGATQANSHKVEGSKEAVAAYRKALEFKPNYVRAWVNMGISYANRGMYDLAAKYYLRALSLNPHADHVWSYLRLAFTVMEREDLAELAGQKDVNAFRKDFQF